jgi:hypothetical protein
MFDTVTGFIKHVFHHKFNKLHLYLRFYHFQGLVCTVKPLSIIPGSVVQFLWSLSESYFNYGSSSVVFPDPLFLFQTPNENDELRFHYIYNSCNWHRLENIVRTITNECQRSILRFDICVVVFLSELCWRITVNELFQDVVKILNDYKRQFLILLKRKNRFLLCLHSIFFK